MKHYLIIFTITLTLAGCQEVYEPGVANVEPFLVIEGYISTQLGPQYIYIKKSVSYNDHPILPGVENAEVYVTSSHDERFDFKHIGRGVYQTVFDSSSRAKIGESYTLHIATSEGDTYISKPQTIQKCPAIEQVKCLYDKQYIVNEDAYGRIVEEEQEGIEIRIQTSAQQQGNSYFRYRYIGYEQQFVSYVTMFDGIVREYWHRLLSYKYLNGEHTINADNFGNKAKIDDQLLFIAENDMTNFGKGYSSDNVAGFKYRFEGLIMRIQQFFVSRDVYEFYSDVERMLEPQGIYFNPPVPVLTSNIICTSDSTQLLKGVFAAVDIYNYFAYIYIQEGRTYISRIDTMPMLNRDSPALTKPADWIDPPF